MREIGGTLFILVRIKYRRPDLILYKANTMKLLSRNEELILLAVWRLDGNAYGITVRDYLKETTGCEYSIGGIYVPLDRLLRKRLLKAYQEKPTPRRGGMSKRFYKITSKGISVLNESRRIQAILWNELPDPEEA